MRLAMHERVRAESADRGLARSQIVILLRLTEVTAGLLRSAPASQADAQSRRQREARAAARDAAATAARGSARPGLLAMHEHARPHRAGARGARYFVRPAHWSDEGSRRHRQALHEW